MLVACNTPDIEQPDIPAPSDSTSVKEERPSLNTTRPEQYRPQVHYTPHHSWMNDPNGLVFDGTTWHLYYQYTPAHNGEGGVHFGEMSWGHATSTNLMHWTERPTVLTPDDMGAIFSGCAVLDSRNVAGFGKDAILAFYTSAGSVQQICLAVSTDHGMTYQKYASNPVVASSLTEFRDPKIVWDDDTQQYIMGIARGWQHGIELWTSTDLLQWSFRGIFRTDIAGCNQGQWECCDFLHFDLDGKSKWVLLLSTNPGSQYNYSGMLYFVGSFDENSMFVPDNQDYPLWFDGGMDCYAGVTFDNAPDGRHVLIAWMNNWDYCTLVPPTVWRSAMTLPRDLALVKQGERYILLQTPSPELETIAQPWQDIAPTAPLSHSLYPLNPAAWQAHLSLSTDSNTDIVLSNREGERFTLTVDIPNSRLVARRTAESGQYLFCLNYAVPTMSAPLYDLGETLDLDIIIDRSSVEVFAADGTCVLTNTVYPTSVYTDLTVSTAPLSARVRPFSSIWAAE